MDKRIIVTIDGPAGSGKTTIARLVADKLNIAYLDTGAMYRGVALVLGEMGDKIEEEYILNILKKVEFKLVFQDNKFLLKMNNKPLGDEIRTEKIGIMASNVAKLPVVRKYLTMVQRKIGQHTSLVAEGRDMGTVVFPNAQFKFFLDARPEIRAKRRVEQLKLLGISADFNEILKEIQRRDSQDSTRAIAPLCPAKDAIKIDTSDLNVAQVAEKVLNHIKNNIHI